VVQLYRVMEALSAFTAAQDECRIWDEKVRSQGAVVVAAIAKGALGPIQAECDILASYQRSLGDAKLLLAVAEAALHTE
jgi:hypothetical protein